MRQPSRPPGQQRQPGGDHRMRRRLQPQPSGQHQPQHGAGLGVIGQNGAGSAVDQRVEIHQPAQHLTRQRPRQPAIGRRQALTGGMGGIVERFAPAQHGIDHAQRGAAGGKAGDFIHPGPLKHLA